MASQFSHQMERGALVQMAQAGFSPSGLERYKLDRLRELRAVIATLRLESEHTLQAPSNAAAEMRLTHA